MRILITGHTGFKGSWLALMLNEMGHEVSGYSLDPEVESHFEIAAIGQIIQRDFRADIRKKESIMESIEDSQPDFIFHLAAQPFVRESLRNPYHTYEVNVNGTLNILQASEFFPNIKGVLIVTTDKVYNNLEDNGTHFSETDPLGYSDPYSTSKAMADLMTQSWSQHSRQTCIGIARAGNVIGGGDFGIDRLIPDLFRNARNGSVTPIRYPKSTRPWQYVLDCLYGYTKQMESMLKGNQGVYNFAPDLRKFATVENIATEFLALLGCGHWELDQSNHETEAHFLSLDSNKAVKELGWNSLFDLNKTLEVTADWYRQYLVGGNLNLFSRRLVRDYISQRI